jgi:SAM-dependent methyltransferase
MTNPRVNYDQIAPEYDARFTSDGLTGTGKALLELTRTLNVSRIVEVACGTGYWLAALHSDARELYGLDLSFGMLSQAQKRKLPIKLVGGLAERLPFEDASFDLVFCVNAMHLFDDSQVFVNEAYRVLRAGGTLAIIGADLHGGKDSWYGFHFFGGTYETDLRRFPAWATVSEWLATVGFEKIELQQVERIVETKRGREVLGIPFSARRVARGWHC